MVREMPLGVSCLVGATLPISRFASGGIDRTGVNPLIVLTVECQDPGLLVCTQYKKYPPVSKFQNYLRGHSFQKKKPGAVSTCTRPH